MAPPHPLTVLMEIFFKWFFKHAYSPPPPHDCSSIFLRCCQYMWGRSSAESDWRAARWGLDAWVEVRVCPEGWHKVKESLIKCWQTLLLIFFRIQPTRNTEKRPDCPASSADKICTSFVGLPKNKALWNLTWKIKTLNLLKGSQAKIKNLEIRYNDSFKTL